MQSPSEDSRKAFHSLDGLRGIAALMVVGRHMNGHLLALFPSSGLAVDFFFALSGFVLQHAYAGRLGISLSLRNARFCSGSASWHGSRTDSSIAPSGSGSRG